MSDNLLSLRLVVVSDSVEDHELFRQAAASAATPIEIVTVGSAAAARGKLAGADLLYLDDGLSGDEIKATVAAARATRNPPFTVRLSGRRRAAEPFETDATADKPGRPEEAQAAHQSLDARAAAELGSGGRRFGHHAQHRAQNSRRMSASLCKSAKRAKVSPRSRWYATMPSTSCSSTTTCRAFPVWKRSPSSSAKSGACTWC